MSRLYNRRGSSCSASADKLSPFAETYLEFDRQYLKPFFIVSRKYHSTQQDSARLLQAASPITAATVVSEGLDEYAEEVLPPIPETSRLPDVFSSSPR